MCVTVFQDRYLQMMFSSAISAIQSQVRAAFGCSLFSFPPQTLSKQEHVYYNSRVVRLLSIGGMMDKVWYNPKWGGQKGDSSHWMPGEAKNSVDLYSRGGGKARVSKRTLKRSCTFKGVRGLWRLTQGVNARFHTKENLTISASLLHKCKV